MAHSGPIRNGPIPYPKADDPLGPELGPGCCGAAAWITLTVGAGHAFIRWRHAVFTSEPIADFINIALGDSE
ncbi:hypothetical protein K4K56_002113 [Colletotrichum sp. SAR 10_98]|nr:hypothetical protein K4K56_002113 [Colletotrichum sp. SAR 10_98]